MITCLLLTFQPSLRHFRRKVFCHRLLKDRKKKFERFLSRAYRIVRKKSIRQIKINLQLTNSIRRIQQKILKQEERNLFLTKFVIYTGSLLRCGALMRKFARHFFFDPCLATVTVTALPPWQWRWRGGVYGRGDAGNAISRRLPRSRGRGAP